MAYLASLRRTVERLRQEQANHFRVIEGRLSGTVAAGALGQIPLILIDEPKPILRNNGYNAFSGMPRVHVAGLSAVLPEVRDGLRQGHVELRFTCGGTFGTFASANATDVHSFC